LKKQKNKKTTQTKRNLLQNTWDSLKKFLVSPDGSEEIN